MEDKALRQLVWIKWLLIGVLLLIIVPMGASAWFMFTTNSELNTASGDCTSLASTRSFKDQAGDLLLSGKEQEVLTLASEREKLFPKDPDVHYYRARAHFQAGEYKKALESFSVAESIAPGWRDQYIAPYSREAKRKLEASESPGSSGASATAELPTDPTEIYLLQLKKASEQQQRVDQLLTAQEQQVKRFNAILERWEKQPGPKGR